MIWRRLALVVVAGVALNAAAVQAVGMPPRDAVEPAAIAWGAALVAGLAGATALVGLRHRSIGAQVAVAVLTVVAAAASGVVAAARAMFIAEHDLDVLVVVVVAAGTVGALVAFALGHRMAQASRSLGVVARRIGEGHPPDAGRPATVELEALARDLEKMSRRLEESRAQERALEASRRELVAWVSHDLRTPLAGIRAMAEALEDGVVSDPETVARYERLIREETDRLAELVDDLFELSRIQAGALRIELERASLGDLVSDALAVSAPAASAKGVRLEGRVTTQAPHLALSIPEVSRALRNLLENAIRHTPSDGAVSVEVGVEDGRAFVSVADSCGGIPVDDLDRVFEPAFRGEVARTPNTEGGAGLGLAIVRGIVEAHHGEIDVRNGGDGCLFVMRLPMQPSG